MLVAVSGGFDPIHIGHLRYLKEAKELGDKLTVILSRDDQLEKKKGFCFMPFEERKEILESIYCVDEVIRSIDQDITSNETLELLRPDIYAKGGDRLPGNMPNVEIDLCNKMRCQIVYGVGGGKIQSSSSLIKKASICRNRVLSMHLPDLTLSRIGSLSGNG